MQLISEERDKKMAPENVAAEYPNRAIHHLQDLRRALDELKAGKIGIEEAKQILQEISTHYEPEMKAEEARLAAARKAAVISEEDPETIEEMTVGTEEGPETTDLAEEAPAIAEEPADTVEEIPDSPEEILEPVAFEEDQAATDVVEEASEITEAPDYLADSYIETDEEPAAAIQAALEPDDEEPTSLEQVDEDTEPEPAAVEQTVYEIDEEATLIIQAAEDTEPEPYTAEQITAEMEEEPAMAMQAAEDMEMESAALEQTAEEIEVEPAKATHSGGETEEERLFREAVQLQRSEETEVFEGRFDIEILPPVNPLRMREFQKRLKVVPGIKILLVTGSDDGGIDISVSAASPVTLISFIRDMPPVSQVNKTNNVIQVVLSDKK